MSAKRIWWSTSSGRIELALTLDQANSAYHQGQCDDDVRALSHQRGVKRQLSEIDPAVLRGELAEYGSWDDAELADHDQNLQRILWLAAAGIVDEVKL